MSRHALACIGGILWFLMTLHVTTILLVPFLPWSATESGWKLLLGSIGISAVLGFAGAHRALSSEIFWTMKRLLGVSFLVLGICFIIATIAMWPRFENAFSSPRFGLLFTLTTILFGPLGFSGLYWIITAKREST